MDKYAPFVWVSYAVALGLLSLTTLGIVWRLYSARRTLDRLEQDDA